MELLRERGIEVEVVESLKGGDIGYGEEDNLKMAQQVLSNIMPKSFRPPA